MSDPILDHLSPSSIESWKICQRRWFFGSFMRVQSFSSYALYSGKLYHKFTEIYYKEKALNYLKKNRKKVSLTDVEEETREYGRGQQEEQEVYWGQNKPIEVDNYTIDGAKEHIKTQGEAILPGFDKEQKPLVERELEVKLDCGLSLIGRLDVQTMDNIIIDHKTKNIRYKSRKLTQNDINKRPQSHLYPFMVPEARGFSWEIALLGNEKKGPQVYSLDLTYHWSYEKTKDYVDSIAKEMIHSVKVGNFVPSYEHFLCSEKYCSYWKHCHSRNWRDL